MTTAERLLEARVFIAAELLRAFDEGDPDQHSVEKWLATLLLASGHARGAVNRLIAQYHLGRLSLSAFTTQAQAEMQHAMGPGLSSGYDHRAPAMRDVANSAGALSALEMLAHGAGAPDTLAEQAVVRGVTSGAALHGVTTVNLSEPLASIQGRLSAIRANVLDGTISKAQGAAQRNSVVSSAVWQTYQGAKRETATSTSRTKMRWNLSPSADHCGSCLEYADGSPYDLDSPDCPQEPGSAASECQSHCQCDATYE